MSEPDDPGRFDPLDLAAGVQLLHFSRFDLHLHPSGWPVDGDDAFQGGASKLTNETFCSRVRPPGQRQLGMNRHRDPL
jgi:hypothetical protein